MEPNEEVGRFLTRVTRDLQVPMALLVIEHPVRSVMAHRGFDQISAIRSLVSSSRVDRQRTDLADNETVGAYAFATVQGEAHVLGTLFVADRRRRWFCSEELHHLDLLTNSARRLIAAGQRAAIDVRTGPQRAVAASV